MNNEKIYAGKAKIIPSKSSLLLPYQRDWVLDNSRLKIAEKSRQIGWTWATAYGLVRRKCRRNERFDAWVTSRDELQAKLFLQDCKEFARILQIAGASINYQVFEEEKSSSQAIEFANCRRIYSLSSNPDAQAGKRGDRVLDEFALNPDPQKLYSIAYPGITWGGQLEIFSTHRGNSNFFNRLVKEIKHNGNPKGFSLHSVSLQKALEQGFLYKLQQKLAVDDARQEMDETDYFNFIKSGCPDGETFLQEYCCVPGDDSSAFFSYDLIDLCKYSAEEKWQVCEPGKVSPSSELYIGVDLGRERDLTVIWILELVGDVLYTRDVKVLEKASFEMQETVLYRWLQLKETLRCCIDRTGIGLQFFERAKKRFGYKVEGIHFTGGIKEELVYAVRTLFEGGKIRIPDDSYVISDLRAIKKTITSAGNLRFDSEHSQSGHSDRFWALALAVCAAKNVKSPTVSIV